MATVLETGESVGVRADEQFTMQSVYKLPIGMAVLRRVDRRELTLEQEIKVEPSEYVSMQQHSPLRDEYPNGVSVKVRALLRYAVSESDGTASDVLMRLAGDALAIQAYLHSLGVQGVRVLNTEKEIGSDDAVQYRNWATPADVTKLLRALWEGRGLSPTSRALLLQLMTDTPTGRRRLKGQLPVGTVVAHKTGTSWTLNGLTAATNDVGLITLPNGNHLAVAVFVSDSKADEATREGTIAQIARSAWEHWK